jgi:hypothetical protein
VGQRFFLFVRKRNSCLLEILIDEVGKAEKGYELTQSEKNNPK